MLKSIELFLSQYPNIIATLGIVIGIFTLWIAFSINKTFGHNHIKVKQIDHVCKLIERLNTSSIEVTFSTYDKSGGYGGSGYGIAFNIFEIGNYDKLESEANCHNKTYEDELVLFYKDSNQVIDIKEFIDNPLTPRNIANELLLFYNSSCVILETNEKDQGLEKFVQIKTGINVNKVTFNKDGKGSLVQGNALACASWLNLKEHSKNLKHKLGAWLIENGIDENNIREDFKNPS